MAKYRKKPVVIEAFQWHEGEPWVDGMENSADYGKINNGKGYPIINTLEGQMEVKSGDYIITGIKGEKYPCKPDIFEATYELA